MLCDSLKQITRHVSGSSLGAQAHLEAQGTQSSAYTTLAVQCKKIDTTDTLRPQARCEAQGQAAQIHILETKLGKHTMAPTLEAQGAC